MQFYSENGLELLSRFNDRPRSVNLHEVLFSNNIDNKSVIEIVGASSTGKTLLLCQFIAKCILPAQYNGIKIHGCDACAILIDTLGHVQMSKLAKLMTSMISNATDAKLPADTIDLIVNKSLKNLTVISCCNNEQLQLTLYMLEDELFNSEKVAVIAIDNILAYYWQERREKGLLSMDQYMKNLVRIIRAQISQFNTVTIYTKWDKHMSEHEAHVNYTNLLKETDVNYRLQLCKSTVTREFIAYIQSTKNIKQIRYTICDFDINWILP